MRVVALVVALGMGVATVLVSPGTATAVTPAPVTVPTVRQWVGGTGSYHFGSASRVVVDSADAGALTGTADTLAGDIGSLTGVPVSTAVGAAKPGDIALRRASIGNPGNTPDARDEAYRLSVGSSITVQASTNDGVFNGTRTVLQLLHKGWVIGAGQAMDWPTYAERGLLVDLGRKFLSIDWLRAEIRNMAYLKMNYLHLHLSDAEGFRLASTTHPEIVSARHYTTEQMSELIGYAARYHVQIVPELDFPAHADAVLAAHPDLKLRNENGTLDNGMIDLSNPASYALIKDLVEEFLPLFPGKYWSIGGDEYVTDYGSYPQLLTFARAHYGQDATAKDAFYGFLNWTNALVHSAGKVARAWNDGLEPGDGTLPLDPDIIVDHWSAEGIAGLPWIGPALSAPALVAQGQLVQNDAFTPTYDTTGTAGQLLTAPTSALYQAWNPTVFVDGNRVSDPAKNLGSMLSVWFADTSITEPQAAKDIHDRLRVMAQQTWGSPKPTSLYASYLWWIHSVGDAPA